MYRKYIKRWLEAVLALVAIICLYWLYIIIAIAIVIDKPGQVLLFKQERIGIHKKRFKISKFRTIKMDILHDVPTHLSEKTGQYITRVGKFLRKISLDGRIMIGQTRKNLDFIMVSPVSSYLFFPSESSYAKMLFCNTPPNRVAKGA